MKIELFQTQDGSPSLNSHITGESMHNRVGAFSETLEIYAPIIEKTLRSKPSPRILSVGLGLGYNEILTSALAVKNRVSVLYLESLELEEFLKNQFVEWLTSGTTNQLSEGYEQILKLTCDHYSVDQSQTKELLKQLYIAKNFEVKNALSKDYQPNLPFQCILYDAYSSNTSPELWNESFLNGFLETSAAKDCLLATYAAKGSLKRSLIGNSFEVTNPSGFGGKRQSTLAQRGHFEV